VIGADQRLVAHDVVLVLQRGRFEYLAPVHRVHVVFEFELEQTKK
jgi:hypothetical protein